MKTLEFNKHVPPLMDVIKPSKQKLCITTQKGHFIIYKKDISHLVAEGNYTLIYFKDQKILCSKTINSVFEQINHSAFIRIHKSYVLNIDHLAYIDYAFSYAITENNHKVQIARSRKQHMKNLVQLKFD
ncbi:MAG: LytTR family DNA-binding domain-containing protein [Saprospiraceae bacterium]|nr:LytTR family DNA-binding domain-containing protein [Saprospiraceae bacterium]